MDTRMIDECWGRWIIRVDRCPENGWCKSFSVFYDMMLAVGVIAWWWLCYIPRCVWRISYGAVTKSSMGCVDTSLLWKGYGVIAVYEWELMRALSKKNTSLRGDGMMAWSLTFCVSCSNSMICWELSRLWCCILCVSMVLDEEARRWLRILGWYESVCCVIVCVGSGRVMMYSPDVGGCCDVVQCWCITCVCWSVVVMLLAVVMLG